MSDKPETVGQLLRYLRKQAGLSLGDVARACEVSVVNISAAERYQREPLSECKSPPMTREKALQMIETDRVLHPYGRCTCAGEGTCEWHRGRCESCWGSGEIRGCSIPCPDCDGSGRKDAESDWDQAEKERKAKTDNWHLL